MVYEIDLKNLAGKHRRFDFSKISSSATVSVEGPFTFYAGASPTSVARIPMDEGALCAITIDSNKKVTINSCNKSHILMISNMITAGSVTKRLEALDYIHRNFCPAG